MVPAIMTRIRDTLERTGIFPYKGRGQHFLINDDTAQKIIELADIGTDDVVVEIGPGTGALTVHLARRAGRVVVVESDRKLAALISETLDPERVEVVFGDALRYDYRALGSAIGKKFKVVANLPYNISTPLIFRLLDAHGSIEKIVLMLQKEVALRLTARPGTKQYGALTIMTSLFAEISIGLVVGRGNFFPVPKVDSAVTVFSMTDSPRVDAGDIDLFKTIVRAAFSNRRKTLRNALKSIPGMPVSDDLDAIGTRAGIDLGRRGETLSPADFGSLARSLGALITTQSHA